MKICMQLKVHSPSRSNRKATFGSFKAGLGPTRPTECPSEPVLQCSKIMRMFFRWIFLLGWVVGFTSVGWAHDVLITEIMYHPASNDPREEFIELYNRGDMAYNLKGWRLTAGVQFTFPSVVLAPGEYLVVAADTNRFAELHPEIIHVVGGWTGQLSDRGETITLRDAEGHVVDRVRYATQGDWAVRQRGPLHRGHRGWIWYAKHDGEGSSLELIEIHRSNNIGQNWAASLVPGGTPGRPNSVAAINVAPFIEEVQHWPAVPHSDQPVTITARVTDEIPQGRQVTLWWRVDGEPEFHAVPMFDDGQHGDDQAGDDVFGAILPPQPDKTIVEFYIEAKDWEGASRTWPAPVEPDHAQLANCLYQVDDTPYQGREPLFRVILTAAEMAEVHQNDQQRWYKSSDAEFNATFISQEADRVEIRYLCSFRIRGTTSRDYAIKSRRIEFPNDHPWHGREAINLNALRPESQILGAAVARLVGLPCGMARPVRLRENGVDPANGGVYAEVEVLDRNFVDRQFPLDSNGNLYRSNTGDLSYLGPDPAPYKDRKYEKKTNRSLDDWSDLIELTDVLTNTPSEEFEREIRRVTDVQEWIRYFAFNTLSANQETCLGIGKEGDFYLYRGIQDPRFVLIPYDLDSMFGVIGGKTSSIWRAIQVPAVKRFLTHPTFARLYYQELQRQIQTAFSPEVINPLIDQLLGDFVSQEKRDQMKRFIAARNEFVLSQIPPQELTYQVNLPFDGYAHTDQSTVSIQGKADPIQTAQVLVNGLDDDWDPVTGKWALPDLPLHPGVNRIWIEALNAENQIVATRYVDLWRTDRQGTVEQGPITQDTVWSPETGPHIIRTPLTVERGATLRLLPGTTVFFDADSSLHIRGRLLAEGTSTNQILFSRLPGIYGRWKGIFFEDADQTNRLVWVGIDYTKEQALFITNSIVVLDHVTWNHISGPVIRVRKVCLIVRNCQFPNLNYGEHISGVAIRPGGRFLIEGNLFGTTTGYNDIMDFTDETGGLVEIRNNLFLGGSDDGLDLDGTTALIEGNVFAHFHKNNSSTSESSAIATGKHDSVPSRLTIVRNIFYDNDYGIVLKDGAEVTIQNNTFLHHRYGALCFAEPNRPYEGPAKSVRLESNIFWDDPVVFAHLNTNWLAAGKLTVQADRCLFPPGITWPGEDNFSEDPRFVNPPEDLHLRPGSPALGSGLWGLDRGAMIPSGAVILDEPPFETAQTTVTLHIAGPAIVAYRYRLDGQGKWSSPRPIDQPLVLKDLTLGPHFVEVLGQDLAGVWQSTPTVSRTWTVLPSGPIIRLSEVLAANRSVQLPDGTTPDLVELVNLGTEPADLGGFRLTNDPEDPDRFIFPTGTVLKPGAYLVLRAATGPADQGYLGFRLNADGDGLWLYAPSDQGLLLIDSIRFGPQIPDLSVARMPDGSWKLAEPTFGRPNRPVRRSFRNSDQ